MTVLVGEDDPLLRHFLTELLSREAGFEVAGSVGAGQELLDAIALLRPDLVLLDLNPLASEGLQIVEQVVERDEAPVVLVLGAAEDDALPHAAARSGARGYLSREQAATTLPEALRAVARGDLLYSPQVCRGVFDEYRKLRRQAREQQEPAALLTPREREVLVRVARGLTNNQIAADLYMSVHTVKLHVQHIFRKLDLPNRTEAAVFAVREGLLDAAGNNPLVAS